MSRTIHVGYVMGPTLAPDEPPWTIGWENDPAVLLCDEETGHRWECVLLAADGCRRGRVEEVVRCADCHAPRCGHTTDPDPCCLVRHHAGHHVSTSVVDKAWCDDPIAQHYGWVKGIPACTTRTCTHGWSVP